MISYECKNIILVALFALAASTEVKQCPNSEAIKLDPSDVSISSCPSINIKGKCILKQNTEVSIDMKFQPKRTFKNLKSDITGIILADLPLPFPGYHGTDACPFIYDAEGINRVGCPLLVGQTYRYKNHFKVLRVYPKISLTVHWGLRDNKGDAVCFEIPAQIK